MGIWRLLPAALGIVVPTMMQVGPDDAVLNLCKWPHKIATTIPENCLPGISDNELYLAAVILVSAGLLWFGWPYFKDGHRRASMIAGILIVCCGVGLGIFGLSIIAGGEKPKSLTQDGPFFIDPNIYSESRAVKASDGRETSLYENTFYLVVANQSDDGKTLRKVQVEYRGYDAPLPAEIKDSTLSDADIKHGNGAFFAIGRIVSLKNIGMFKGSVIIDDDHLKSFEHNDMLDAISFHVSGGSKGKYHFALGNPPYPPTGWILIAVISAEDKKSRVVRLTIDARDKTHPVRLAKDENGQ